MAVSSSGSFHLPPALRSSAAKPAFAPERTAAEQTPEMPAADQAPPSEWTAIRSPGISLWDLLTPEERSVFAERAAFGALTYGMDGQPAAAAILPTGSRIDVKG